MILYYARLHFVIKMKYRANTGNSKSDKLGGWVAAHARSAGMLGRCNPYRSVPMSCRRLPMVSILSSCTVRPRPSGRGYQVHSTVLTNVVVMLDSKERRTYPMRHFCALTTEIK